MASVDLNKGKVGIKQKSRNPIIKFDKLKMYFGYPYEIKCNDDGGVVTMLVPTIGDIIEFGIERFYQTLNVFITNTTSYRLILWNIGIDWNELSDFALFTMLYKSIDIESSRFIFGDLDWNSFSVYSKKDIEGNESVILYNPEINIEINENTYFQISQYLRNVFNIFPEEKITKDKIMKQWFINKDIREKANEESKTEQSNVTSSLLATISACVNHPGFKYNIEQLKDVNMCQFYDSVKRLQIYENTTAIMKGMYSGFVDGKNLKQSDYNFMREI